MSGYIPILRKSTIRPLKGTMDLSFSDLVAVQKELEKRLDEAVNLAECEEVQELLAKVAQEIEHRLRKIDTDYPF